MKTITVDVPEDYVEWRCNQCHNSNVAFCVNFRPSICTEPVGFACPLFAYTRQVWTKIEPEVKKSVKE